MTSKYHVSPSTGKPGLCVASERDCPVGGQHFASEQEARAAYEAQMGSGLTTSSKKDTSEAEALIAEYRELLALRTPESFGRIRELQTLIPTVLPDPPTAEAMMAKIETPDGFTRTETMVDIGWGGHKNLVPQLGLKNRDVHIVINFSDVSKDSYVLADGHVSFRTDKGWRSFDQRGIEDSFYIDNPLKNFSLTDPTDGINETITDFVERKVPEARSRIDGSSVVPGLNGRLISEHQKIEFAMTGRVTLYPSGFGIGYHLSNEPVPPLGSRPASDEQKAFFGVTRLWISELDCD